MDHVKGMMHQQTIFVFTYIHPDVIWTISDKLFSPQMVAAI